MAGWWDGGMVGWRDGGMMKWRDGGMAGWWDGGMVGWRDGGMVGWWDGGMVGWRDGGMMKWRDGGMAGWWDGGMVGWRDGGMAGWWKKYGLKSEGTQAIMGIGGNLGKGYRVTRWSRRRHRTGRCCRPEELSRQERQLKIRPHPHSRHPPLPQASAQEPLRRRS